MNRVDKLAKKLIHKITKTPETTSLPKNITEILFQHHSPHELSTLIPQTYLNIAKQRLDDMSPSEVKEYIDDRKTEEKKYRVKLEVKDENKSFTYASIVGFNLMEDALDYPGFTYFFHLNKEQIDKTLFGIVGGKKFKMEPELGPSALISCLSAWKTHIDELASYDDEILGSIDPRIEVVIPYIVIPELVIMEVEQR